MNDMADVIIPKSDQWNYDDFQAGALTFKITGVKVSRGAEQPVNMSLEGTEKFYRPCKSMARVLVAAWGADSLQYVGKSITLYGDPKVRWGGMEVGGIRISHMSDIPEAMTLALTATKASRKPYTVRPLVIDTPEPETDWNTAILSAQTLPELGDVWTKVPKRLKAELTALKDQRKAELSAKAPE